MSILSELSQLKSITQEEQKRGTEKLMESGIEYDDETIEGVIDKMGGKKYTAGNGIEISNENEISTKIGEGLEYGPDRAIQALPNIESAVIISEADARYLLHEYTEIKYTAGNRIGYAGPQNQIVVQEYVFNYTTLVLPETAPYRGVTFAKSSENETGDIIENADFYLEYTDFTTASANVQMKCDEYNFSTVLRTTADTRATGVYLEWNTIKAPNDKYPYGYVYGKIVLLFKQTTTATTMTNGGSKYLYIPFASEAEYNAAVRLTYEPVELTEVQETVTEV